MSQTVPPLTQGLLNERLLQDAGGWQAMKQARALYEMGRVGEATWEPPLLQGRVKEGESEFRSGLKILSKSNVENLCGCRQSRQHGAICAHSLAVGLAVLKMGAKPVAAAPAQTPRPEGPHFHLEQGQPLELSAVLPPNFVAAWDHGQITVAIEAAVGGRRLLLPGLDKKGEYRVNEADLRVLEALRGLAGGQLPGVMALGREPMLKLLAALKGHPEVKLGKNGIATVEEEPLRPSLDTERLAGGALELRVHLAREACLLRAGSAQPWIVAGTVFQEVAPGLPAAYGDLLERPIVVPAEAANNFLLRELPLLSAHFDMGDDLPVAAPEAAVPTMADEPVGRFRLELEGSLNFLTARLHAETAALALAAGKQAHDRLRASGFAGPDGEGKLQLKGEQRILAFFAKDLPRWEREADVTIGERFQNVTENIERIRPKLEVKSSGERWFDLHVELGTAGGEKFSGAEIQRLLQSGHTYVRTKSGKTAVFDPALLDDLAQTLRDCEGTQTQPGTYRLQKRQAAYLQGVMTEQGTELRAPAAWRKALQVLQTPGELPPVDLGSLEEVLRPYQKQGVSWMAHLARNHLAGILADEMGLGKTVQTLAVLRALGGKALIVCPSTLVYNWQREAAKFTPERKVLAIEGGARQSLFGTPLREADLVITSYALLRRDAENYLDTDFKVAVLDEAQHIKNPDTQNAQMAYAMRAQHRFVLTGTPVENSVRDIWSLMHFLMPGYLGSQEDFRDRYEKPIATTPDGAEQRRLGKRLRPFILRRRKKDVITELPDKIEQVSYCELTPAQKTIYGELLDATRRQLSEYADAKDQNKARMVMLTALLRLRQACCDLRLLKMPKKPAEKETSGKLELFGELLQEMLDDGHRVLVFSQFVEMLKLLEEWLRREKVDYCYLDGSTKRRGEVVDRFQTGEVPVFLISLKAGGTGLNLTAADTVVHFDPWWNPAVEAQATDRAHRIGQKKVVTSYKLITRGTIEEKILNLQARKRQLIEATVESEEPMMQGLTTRELEELLE